MLGEPEVRVASENEGGSDRKYHTVETCQWRQSITEEYEPTDEEIERYSMRECQYCRNQRLEEALAL